MRSRRDELEKLRKEIVKALRKLRELIAEGREGTP